jgi:hypothetical protein
MFEVDRPIHLLISPLSLQNTEKETGFTFFQRRSRSLMISFTGLYFLDKSSNPCSAEEGVKVMEMMDRFTKKN